MVANEREKRFQGTRVVEMTKTFCPVVSINKYKRIEYNETNLDLF